MEAIKEPRVLFAERSEDGVIVKFRDGRTAVYSSFLLNAVYDLAVLMNEADQLEAAAS
jgi:hypothetical protein